MSITDKIRALKSPFTTKEAENNIANEQINRESVRARIYEAVDKGILKKIARGLYSNNDCLLIEGDGKDLSFLKDGSIDSIITDHPYDIKGSNNGGNRHFAEYGCFRYSQHDFDEKARVLKEGSFLVEFLPEESAENYEYLHDIKIMAKKAGLEYYAKVSWQKGDFVANCGRKSKNTEDVMFFTKGKARNLRHDKKKELKTNRPAFMSGASAMLPTAFNFPKPKKMIHQAEKPVELLSAIIEYVTKPQETILDQFAGSGSLGEAAEKSGRNSILVELDDKYVKAIAARLNLIPAY